MLQALFTSAVVFCNIDQLLIQITDFFFFNELVGSALEI